MCTGPGTIYSFTLHLVHLVIRDLIDQLRDQNSPNKLEEVHLGYFITVVYGITGIVFFLPLGLTPLVPEVDEDSDPRPLTPTFRLDHGGSHQRRRQCGRIVGAADRERTPRFSRRLAFCCGSGRRWPARKSSQPLVSPARLSLGTARSAAQDQVLRHFLRCSPCPALCRGVSGEWPEAPDTVPARAWSIACMSTLALLLWFLLRRADGTFGAKLTDVRLALEAVYEEAAEKQTHGGTKDTDHPYAPC